MMPPTACAAFAQCSSGTDEAMGGRMIVMRGCLALGSLSSVNEVEANCEKAAARVTVHSPVNHYAGGY